MIINLSIIKIDQQPLLSDVDGGADVRVDRPGGHAKRFAEDVHRAIATNEKPSAIAWSIVSRRVTPPSRTSGIVSSARNCRASGRRNASSNG